MLVVRILNDGRIKKEGELFLKMESTRTTCIRRCLRSHNTNALLNLNDMLSVFFFPTLSNSFMFVLSYHTHQYFIYIYIISICFKYAQIKIIILPILFLITKLLLFHHYSLLIHPFFTFKFILLLIILILLLPYPYYYITF